MKEEGNTYRLTIYLRDLGQGGNRVGEGYRVLAELVHVEVVNAGSGKNTDYVGCAVKVQQSFCLQRGLSHWTRGENKPTSMGGSFLTLYPTSL